MKKNSKNNEVLFESTPEGKSPDAFKSAWYSLPFGQQTGPIDTEKLYWTLLGYSEQGHTYRNWMSAARTFYLRYPQQYQIKNGTAATQRAIEFDQSNQQVSAARGIEYFIPAHLNNNEGGN